METPLSDAAISSFPEFAAAVRSRLDRGRKDYGDVSFTRPIPELLEELAQECLDIAGWGFVLWTRAQRLLNALELAVPTVRDTAGELGEREANL